MSYFLLADATLGIEAASFCTETLEKMFKNLQIAFRLSTGEGDGAWCPAGAVFPNESEYLQVPHLLLQFQFHAQNNTFSR